MEMIEPGFSPERNNIPQLSGVLQRVCGELGEINPAFSVLSDLNSGNSDISLFEFYSKKLESHIVMFSEDGSVGNSHRRLADKDIKLFPEIGIGGDVLLIIPEGSRSLDSLMPLVASNTANYRRIFMQLGLNLRKLNEAKFGMPSGKSILEQFAFAVDETNRAGSDVYFTPPYDLSVKQTPEDVLLHINQELIELNTFSDEDIKNVMKGIISGWSDLG